MEVGVHLRCLLLAVVFTLPCTLSQQWEKDPFINIAPRDELEYLDYNSRGQSINLDEEIEGEVTLALFNYAGNTKPELIGFQAGTNADLGAEIREGDPDSGRKWYLYITKRQDYENPLQQRYVISFSIGTQTETLYLNIINIDDNDPVIQGGTCQVEELYIGLTDCAYTVTDADGELSIKAMTFAIEGRYGEEDMFAFEEIRNDTTFMSMFIILKTVVELDYAESQIHIFTIVASDSAANEGRVNAVIQVIDMPNMPPIWKTIFASQRFDEKTIQNFQVVAVDGDTGINKQIMYKLYKDDTYTFFSIDKESGILHVDKMDRDALEQEVFQFVISAYKVDNETWETTSMVSIIIDDINDKTPDVQTPRFEIDIDEEKFTSLEFDSSIFIHDRDLGDNANYEVSLVSVNPSDAADSFIIIPEEGYQRQEFKIIIVAAQNLDFENVPWQHIELTIKSVEKKDHSHIGTASVFINLNNWNDELPIFEKEEYTVSFEETVGKGYEVATVRATDRDIDDSVKHSLVGSVNNYLEIDEETGKIVVSIDDAFNYNRQDEIIVQVMAKDQLGEPSERHTTYAQLIIKLIDVNHQQPEIRMPQETIRVEENVPKGYEITDLIKGSDPDKKGVIEFSIDWSKSSAIKPGKNVDLADFKDCVKINTVYPDPDKKGEAIGVLVVQEIRDNVTIDFEKFETLYLSIVLTDTDQTIGINVATGTLSVIIDDVNDNAPEWVTGSLETKRIVRERSDNGIFIGSVLATDEDGPLYNNVKYYLQEGENTPKGLVAIDEKTGQLTVEANKEIMCDYPDPRDKLFYDITASDCADYDDEEERCFRTPGKIEIDIIDVNNQNPIVKDDEFENDIKIWEDAKTGTPITKIIATDLDRDEPYSTITYAINYAMQAELRKYFTVNSATGELIVTLEDGEELDRDEGDYIYNIYITLTDNYLMEGDGQRNTDQTMITVTLLDVNDNAPIFPNDLSWSISENTLKNIQLNPEVVATDKDEPNTDNSRVQYKVLSLKAASSQNPGGFPEDLINILSPDNKTGILVTNYPLKGYWGTYTIELLAFDLGVPQQSSTKEFELKIPPYNFESPTFVFPVEGAIYRLKLENAYPGALNYAVQGRFDDIVATDPDGLGGGIVTFEVVGKDDAVEFFTVDSQDDNMGRLVLTKKLDSKTEFEITIRAKDQGTDPNSLETEVTFKVIFVETEGEPKFDEHDDTAKFTEFEAGWLQSKEFPRAWDPKNIGCTVDCADIYYYIMKGTSSEFFSLDKNTNTLTIAKELDRSQQQTHEIIIAATNNRNQIEAVPSPDSILNVVIEVGEANPMPRFNQSLYAGGVSITDKIGKQMFILMATHSENLVITYTIDRDSMKVDSSLEGVKETAFILNEKSGEVLLNFNPLGSMSGMFEFNAIATDTVNIQDIAAVKVYMIADNNRVSFIFENILTDVQEENKFIADTFTKIFGFQCNIDYILVASDNGVALDGQTEVRSHFINNSVALDAQYISELSTDLTLMRNLRDELRLRSLYLEDFSTTKSETPSDSLEQMLQIVLIVVSSVLGTLCIVLLIAFCLRTKSLNRRLQALSETKFGSQSSGLNRTGLGATVPGTNKHALEGSNPVWNEEIKAPDFDAISNISGDSDLIGVEDNPQFAYEDPAKNNKPRRNTVFEKQKNTAPRRATRQNINSLGNENNS